MQISFILEPEDLSRATWRNAPASYWRRWVYLLLFVAGLAGFTAYRILQLPVNERGHALVTFLPQIVIMGLLLASYVYSTTFAVRRQARKTSQRVGTVTIRLSQSELFVETATGQTGLSWKAIKRVYQDDHCLYICLSDDPNCFIIHKRAFDSTDDAQVFLEAAQSYHHAAIGDARATAKPS